MKGYFVGVLRMVDGSVMVKQRVKTATYPRAMLIMTPQKIARGSVSEASLSSSLMWTAQS